MNDPMQYFLEFNVAPRNLTEEQIYNLNKELKYFVRKLVIVSIILFIALFFLNVKLYGAFEYLYPKAILILPVFMIHFYVDQWESTSVIILVILTILMFYLPFKFYEIVGHYVISSKVKSLELKNLETKVEKLNKQVNKIKALGKTK